MKEKINTTSNNQNDKLFNILLCVFILIAGLCLVLSLGKTNCLSPFNTWCSGRSCPLEYCDSNYIHGSCLQFCFSEEENISGWYNETQKIEINKVIE
jgi:hypothetical protein